MTVQSGQVNHGRAEDSLKDPFTASESVIQHITLCIMVLSVLLVVHETLTQASERTAVEDLEDFSPDYAAWLCNKEHTPTTYAYSQTRPDKVLVQSTGPV